MKTKTLAGVLLLSSLLMHGGRATAQPADSGATLFRVFLKDGGSLVSYGEIARVGDRVVFSMPIGVGIPPTLHLTTVAASRVDWDRTDRYAMTARSGRYLETQAENDYVELSNQVAQTLYEVGQTNDPARRVELIENARRTLAVWPVEHFNYREGDIHQLLTMLDAAIADLRTSTQPGSPGSRGQFAFNLVAFSTPPPVQEPLLPAPTLAESIAQVLLAARVSDSSFDRQQLYKSALAELDRSKALGDGSIPTQWIDATRANVTAAIATEARADRNYRSLSQRLLTIADQRAREGNVRALERLIDRVHVNDDLLGNIRPDVIASLLSNIEAKLDAARRLQLARDRWALRAPEYSEYRVAMQDAFDQFVALKVALESIKSLAGTPPNTLNVIERTMKGISLTATAVHPPDELVDAHALFISAVNLAQNAASIRREATLLQSITRAWDASSAAAGALMLGTKARADIQKLTRRPQLQ
ncbi:MAG TPA: hypothetical protein VFP91_22490 [Vicinamibacterales bacterium]|nr:hypothetical protein [Vicinamibacterales bacterium]